MFNGVNFVDLYVYVSGVVFFDYFGILYGYVYVD